jgi:Bacterial Ig domain
MAQRPPLTTDPDPQYVTEGNGGATKEQIIADKKKAAAKVPLPNYPPVMNPIPPQTAHPNQPLAFQATALDPDGNPLTFSLINSPPAGASMDGQGNFTWTPTWAQLGAYTLSARVSDPSGASDTKFFTVTVGNQPPTVNPLPNLLSAHPDRPLQFTATATDPDQDPLTFSLVNPPAGAAIDSQGNFTWTPTWAQLGAYTITVKATDPGNLSNTRSATVTVANQPPTVDPLPNLPAAHPDQPVTFQATASDPDQDPLTFSLVNPPVGAAIDDQGNFSWTPTWAQLGAATITVKATDPGGLSNSRSMTINVVNQPPTLDPLPAPTSGHPDQPIAFTATASDPDQDPLTFSLVNPPAGATIDSSGNFSWTPTWAQLGAQIITVRVTDPGGLNNTRAVTITIANQAPSLSPLQDLPATKDTPVTFTASATDPDNDPLTFSLVNPPNGASIDSIGNFNWTPVAGQEGANTITVKVTDPGGLFAIRSCTITVAA